MSVDNYDLRAAIEYNPGGPEGVCFDEIESVPLELTGENDERDWHWIVRLTDGTFAYLEGGCDYTGWDCQSHLNYHRAPTLDGALALVVPDLRGIFREMLTLGETRRDAPGRW